MELLGAYFMGFDNSLMDVMNTVSKALDDAIQCPRPSAVQTLTELDAFAMNDELLASLRKQYLDAKVLRINSQKQYGADDGMTELAMLGEDSAWCAMQTRYLELRDNRDSMAAAQNVMLEAERIEKHRIQKEEERDALAYYKSLQMMKEIKERDKFDYAFLIFAMLMLQNTYKDMFRSNKTHVFNRLVA
jgi:hypothetical protein